jgi:hypothetical protein
MQVRGFLRMRVRSAVFAGIAQYRGLFMGIAGRSWPGRHSVYALLEQVCDTPDAPSRERAAMLHDPYPVSSAALAVLATGSDLEWVFDIHSYLP